MDNHGAHQRLVLSVVETALNHVQQLVVFTELLDQIASVSLLLGEGGHLINSISVEVGLWLHYVPLLVVVHLRATRLFPHDLTAVKSQWLAEILGMRIAFGSDQLLRAVRVVQLLRTTKRDQSGSLVVGLGGNRPSDKVLSGIGCFLDLLSSFHSLDVLFNRHILSDKIRIVALSELLGSKEHVLLHVISVSTLIDVHGSVLIDDSGPHVASLRVVGRVIALFALVVRGITRQMPSMVDPTSLRGGQLLHLLLLSPSESSLLYLVRRPLIELLPRHLAIRQAISVYGG